MEINMQELFGPWASSICSPVCSHPSCWAAKKNARQGLLPESGKSECWLEGLDRSNRINKSIASTARSGPVLKTSPDNHHGEIRNARTINDILIQTGPWCYARFFFPKETTSVPTWCESTENGMPLHYLNEQVKLPHDKRSKVCKGHKQVKSQALQKTK